MPKPTAEGVETVEAAQPGKTEIPKPGPDQASNAPLWTHDDAIAIMSEVVRASAWMERLAEKLGLMITNPHSKLAEMAEAYILAKNVNDDLEAARIKIGNVVKVASYNTIPERMLDEKQTSFNTESGFRIGISNRTSATVVDKSLAFAWLRANGLEGLITETVNAQTLSSQVRQMIEEENKEPPENAIKVSTAPYTSVTKVKPKK